MLVPKNIMPKSDNPDDYGAVIDYLRSNYKEDIKKQVPNTDQILESNDSIKENLHKLEETKEFYTDQIINKLNEVKKSYAYWYDLIISKGLTDYYSAIDELNENKSKINKIKNMIQQQIVKNKKQIVYGKNKKDSEKLIKELKIELDELTNNNTKFIKYLKSKAKKTDIDDLGPTFDEIVKDVQENQLYHQYYHHDTHHHNNHGKKE